MRSRVQGDENTATTRPRPACEATFTHLYPVEEKVSGRPSRPVHHPSERSTPEVRLKKESDQLVSSLPDPPHPQSHPTSPNHATANQHTRPGLSPAAPRQLAFSLPLFLRCERVTGHPAGSSRWSPDGRAAPEPIGEHREFSNLEGTVTRRGKPGTDVPLASMDRPLAE